MKYTYSPTVRVRYRYIPVNGVAFICIKQFSMDGNHSSRSLGNINQQMERILLLNQCAFSQLKRPLSTNKFVFGVCSCFKMRHFIGDASNLSQFCKCLKVKHNIVLLLYIMLLKVITRQHYDTSFDTVLFGYKNKLLQIQNIQNTAPTIFHVKFRKFSSVLHRLNWTKIVNHRKYKNYIYRYWPSINETLNYVLHTDTPIIYF